jgi:uncharacterized protein (DUF1684 family)
MPMRVAVVLLLALAVPACGGDLSYEEEIAAWRADKDEYMRSDESPVEAADRRGYPPLSYYATSQDYRIPGVAQPGRIEGRHRTADLAEPARPDAPRGLPGVPLEG